MAQPKSIYGAPRPSSTKKPPPQDTASTAFSSALSSLIASSSTAKSPKPNPTAPSNASSSSQSRNAKNGTKKRTAAEMLNLPAPPRMKPPPKESGALDEEAWTRAKRRMDEKARLYSALKRGDVEDDGEKYGVDFDRKWAERGGGGAEFSDQDSSSEDGGEDGGSGLGVGGEMETVEWADEFGRTRRGTAGEAAQAKRRLQRGARAAKGVAEFRARPVRPENVIRGDAVQAAAFNPDEGTAAQMEELAAKRDREATPPEAARYDSKGEVRSKGTGFFVFSRDEGERGQQMEGLEEERRETERVRGEKVRTADERRRRREEEIEERRRVIKEKRERAQADRFLEDLGKEIGVAEQKRS